MRTLYKQTNPEPLTSVKFCKFLCMNVSILWLKIFITNIHPFYTLIFQTFSTPSKKYFPPIYPCAFAFLVYK